MDNRKERLADKLQIELDNIRKAASYDTIVESEEAIDYLRTGIKPDNYNDIIVSIDNDFETICSDYGV